MDSKTGVANPLALPSQLQLIQNYERKYKKANQ